MPLEQQLAHRVFRDPSFPYISNTTPLSTDPYFVSGSSDILTSIAQYAQRRPGFADNVEPTPTVFNNLQRLFTWDRFDGTFYVMFCDIDATNTANVYKMQVGTDASAVLIYTEASATGTPYDFVVSNNTLYFGNGFYMKKWDPVNGLSNWGIAAYLANTSLSAFCTSASDLGSSWIAPTNIQHAANAGPYATATLAHTIGHGVAQSSILNATGYTFGIANTNTISTISVAIRGHIVINSGIDLNISLTAQLTQSGNAVGNPIGFSWAGTLSDTTFTYAGGLWGATWSGTTLDTIGVNIQASAGSNFAPNDHNVNVTFSIDSVVITVAYFGGPLVTLVAGPLTASTGYQYVVCYGNSNTGHIGSPSPPSNLVKPISEKMQIPVVASTDPQVNQIHIFRTTDSASGLGGQSYFEIPQSPVVNANATIVDPDGDLTLNIFSVAPTPTFNDPPPPMRGMVYFSGRIWGFTGNKVWFTGLEEITVGVPEECVPSGVAGNFWSFDQPVQGLGVAGNGSNQGLGVLCGGRIYGITGNTLDTFRRMSISNRRGCRNLTTISSMGGMCAWLDSSNQVWMTNGSDMQELSIPIRPDIASVIPANCDMTFHAAGTSHWLVFSTGTKLFVYDMDTEQWMPPWNFAATYLFSGETSPGNYVLMASNGTKAIQLNQAKFNDNGVLYSPIIKTNLMSVVPDFGKRFSYIGQGMYDEPSRTGVPFYVEVDTNDMNLEDIGFMVDDDPTTAVYTSIKNNQQEPDMVWNRRNGINILQQIYPMNNPSCRWLGLKITLEKADRLDKIYSYFLAYKSLGGK